MEQTDYSCQYCKKKFTPKRRKVQKFCTNTCRASFHRFKNDSLSINQSTEIKVNTGEKKSGKTKVDQISAAGVGNAALGTGLVELAKNIFTPGENKPATKGDIMKLAASLKRFHKIKNLPPNIVGEYPYFDLTKGEVVYLKMSF